MMSNSKVTFRVEFLTDETVDMTYPTDEAGALAEDLDRATTILGCPDCGDLAPVTGGIPKREMPRCPRCDESLHGVVDVIVVRDDRADE